MPKAPPIRWIIVAMIFLASVLNYVDRQALSILAPTIQSDLGLTTRDYAFVVNLFLVAYTIGYLFSGKLVDKIGVRAGFALFVFWWSVANMLTAFARSMATLGAFRFLLGLGEAGNWTAAPKAVAEWFPARERGLAIGIYTLGATIGATIAPILVIQLASWHSWQAVFVVTGIGGLLWVVPWYWLYRQPEHHPFVSTTERALITEGRAPTIQPKDVAAGATAERKLWRLVLSREVWLLMLARLFTDPVWYFYQFWFAKYLYDARQLDQKSLAITWVIFLAADVGALSGGWLSGRLIKRQVAPAASRLWVMLGCACLVPASAVVPYVSSLGLVLALGMVAIFAHMAWLINLSALVVDIIPERSLGTIFGVIAAGSAVGGIAMNWGVGQLVTYFSYTPAFTIAACMHPIALLLLWRMRATPVCPAPSLAPA